MPKNCQFLSPLFPPLHPPLQHKILRNKRLIEACVFFLPFLFILSENIFVGRDMYVENFNVEWICGHLWHQKKKLTMKVGWMAWWTLRSKKATSCSLLHKERGEAFNLNNLLLFCRHKCPVGHSKLMKMSRNHVDIKMFDLNTFSSFLVAAGVEQYNLTILAINETLLNIAIGSWGPLFG